VATVLKSGSLNLLEPLGPVQACNGIALPFTVYFRVYYFTYTVYVSTVLTLPMAAIGRFKYFRTVLQVAVLRVLVPCSLLRGYGHFGRHIIFIFKINLQRQRSILMIQSSGWSEKLLSIYQNTRCHRPDYHSYNSKTSITKFQTKVAAFRKDDISTFGTNFGCSKIIRTCSWGLLIFRNIKCLLKVHSQKLCFSFEHTVAALETRFFFVCSECWEPLKLLDTP